ncbi:MAG: membrane protein insertase YidC [Pseudomonadota bacterium]
MSEQLKTFIGILLSFSIILFGPPIMKNYVNHQTTENNIENNTNHQSQQNNTNHQSTNTNLENNIKSNTNIILNNDHLTVKITNNIITECLSKQYQKTDKLHEILQNKFIINQFHANDIKTPDHKSEWQIIKNTSRNAILRHQDKINNITYTIQYSLDDLYNININTEITDNTENNIINIISTSYDESNIITTCQNNSLSDHIKNETINHVQWANKHAKYWSQIFYNYSHDQNNQEQVISLEKKSSNIEFINKKNINILLAPKSLSILNKYENTLPLIDRTIDFGWLYFITKPISIVLHKINNITNDYGIAIIILTILIQLSLLYFHYKGYISMKKMKLIQPELNKINSQYANDAITKSNKTFELYKRENISIFSQMIPIILQLPIFYSIFKIVGSSIELSNMPSIYIIKDITSLDTTNILSFLSITQIKLGILPILTGVSFFLHNASNPQTNNMEFMQYLPFIMIFIAQTTFPTGLMLYLISNNLLTAIRQVLMNKLIIIK